MDGPPYGLGRFRIFARVVLLLLSLSNQLPGSPARQRLLLSHPVLRIPGMESINTPKIFPRAPGAASSGPPTRGGTGENTGLC